MLPLFLAPYDIFCWLCPFNPESSGTVTGNNFTKHKKEAVRYVMWAAKWEADLCMGCDYVDCIRIYGL